MIRPRDQPLWWSCERIHYPLPLVRFAALLFARTLSCECLLGATTITWLQVERMLLDVLDDIFLLDLPLETAERAFNGLAFLHLDFSQT